MLNMSLYKKRFKMKQTKLNRKYRIKEVIFELTSSL